MVGKRVLVKPVGQHGRGMATASRSGQADVNGGCKGISLLEMVVRTTDV